MDTPAHQQIYAQGLEMRKKVVGEDYVNAALEKGGSDFMRPLQQFATVCVCHSLLFFLSLSFILLHLYYSSRSEGPYGLQSLLPDLKMHFHPQHTAPFP